MVSDALVCLLSVSLETILFRVIEIEESRLCAKYLCGVIMDGKRGNRTRERKETTYKDQRIVLVL